MVKFLMGDYLDGGPNPDEKDDSFLSGEGTERSDDASDSDVEEDDGRARVVDNFSEMCRHKQCLDDRCLERRSLVAKMEEFLRLGNFNNITGEILSWFKRICRHSRLCDEPRCRVPFCQYFSSHLYDDDLPWVKHGYERAGLHEYWKIIGLETVMFMDTKVAWPSGHVAPEQPQIHSINSSVEKLWKLERFPNDVEHHFCYEPILDSTKTRYAPRPGTDFNIMCEYLEEARYISIAEARVIGSPFMMKMEQCFFKARKDYLDNHLANLRKLVDCCHENLSHLLCLFLLKDDSLISAYRYDFNDRSFEELCGAVGNGREVRQIVSGVARGASFLHGKGLFFLNWTASALSCCKFGDRVIGKLYDFQYVFNSGNKSEQELSSDEDLDTIIECLDASCIPPELLECPKQVGTFTEAYGLGAITYQLITGMPLLYEFRHKGRIKQIEAIDRLVPDELGLGDQWQEFVPILANLLGPHQGRMKLEELEQLQ